MIHNKNVLERTIYFKKQLKKISVIRHISFFKDRNYDFKIFYNEELSFIEKVKIFFTKKTPPDYDPYNIKYYGEDLAFLIESGYPKEELMIIYYEDYFTAWNDTHTLADVVKYPGTRFQNLSRRVIYHDPIIAEGTEGHYPFEMFATSQDGPIEDLESDFDSVMHDPFTGERLKAPLTTLRWNYYMKNFLEDNEDVYFVGALLADDLEENNDFVTALLETIHDPKFRDTVEFTFYLKYTKLRHDTMLVFFSEYYAINSLPLFIMPWFVCFLVGDCLTHELNHSSMLIFDLETIFLYIFFGYELIWKFEDRDLDFLALIYGHYKKYSIKYKKSSSTFQKDLFKVWRLINLKSKEPKIYRKLKHYYILVLQKKLFLAVAGLRSGAAEQKALYKHFILDTVLFVKLLIYTYRTIIRTFKLNYKILKKILKNVIPSIILFIINFFKTFFWYFINVYKSIFNFFFSKDKIEIDLKKKLEETLKVSKRIFKNFKETYLDE